MLTQKYKNSSFRMCRCCVFYVPTEAAGCGGEDAWVSEDVLGQEDPRMDAQPGGGPQDRYISQ